MSVNVNSVTITGNLTKAPEFAYAPSGMAVVTLRVAVNGRRKDQESGQWVDKPNFFDVKVLGEYGEMIASHLYKGSPVAVDGRLDWYEYETQNGDKRQGVQIVAKTVQPIVSSGGGGGAERAAQQASVTNQPVGSPGTSTY